MARPVAGRRSAAAALPEWIPPQLTRLVDAAAEGDQWLHEIKFDGYRMHARVDRGNVRLLTRTGLDWTHKYAAVAAAVASLGNDCLEPLPAVIRDIAWKAQVRLCARYRRLAASGKPKVVVTTAIAREMVGFIWAIARVAQPALD